MGQTIASVSRRSLVKGAGLAAGAAIAGTAAAAAFADEPAGCTYPDSIAWNAVYDVVVIGFGGAGATAARFAADAGAKVLLVDSAPEGHEGGNTRYCAQLIASAASQEDMMTYYRGLAWKFDLDEEVFEVYTAGEVGMKDYIRDYLGVEPVGWKDNDSGSGHLVALLKAAIPEYPNLEGCDTFDFLTVHDSAIFDAALWRKLRDLVKERADQIDVWLESPATGLIQDPATKTVVGVRIEHDGQTALVRAVNGVVLACGGFENNTQMVQDYLGAPRLAPLGSLYNTGDGVRMAIEVGAELWHMHNYEALGMLGGNAIYVNEADGRARLTYWTVANGSIVVVGDDGGRFMKEDDMERHGHFYSNGVWRIPTPQYTPHLLFDQTKYDWFEENFATLPNKEFMSTLVSAATLPELAELIGADPEILQQTVDHWNAMCEAGVDYEKGRAAETMQPFDGGPYYAAALRPVVLNTQGGPRRSARSEVMDTQGNPIPHLYSAGELGGVTPFQYQGGGNIAECLIFGKIAGENAAAAKDELPVVAGLSAVEDDLREYSSYDFASEYVQVELGDNQYLGTSETGIGGVIQVVLTMDGDAISACDVVRHTETDMYGGAALMSLPLQVVEANGTDIDGASGATCTTNAFKAAVEDALSQARA